MGPIYDGIAHYGSSPEDFLPVIVLGLFVGLRGARHSRLSLSTLTAAWLTGGLAALLGLVPPGVALSTGTAGLFLLIGGMLAANVDLAPQSCALVAGVHGLVRGSADLAGAAGALPPVLSLLGMAASAFAILSLAASLTLPLTRLWMVVVARVGGSWLAALGLLLVGWIVRDGAHVA
jgi:hydrogenase/urease accessory protein HupE